MSSRGETREQPSIPDIGELCPEHVSLGVAIASITAALVALIVDYSTDVEVLRGAYAISAGVFVAGCLGWVVGSAERRVRRDLGGAVAELTTALAELRDQVAHQRVTYLPSPRRSDEGQRYVGAVPLGAGDTVPAMPTVSPDVEAALRRINMRVVNGGESS